MHHIRMGFSWWQEPLGFGHTCHKLVPGDKGVSIAKGQREFSQETLTNTEQLQVAFYPPKGTSGSPDAVRRISACPKRGEKL